MSVTGNVTSPRRLPAESLRQDRGFAARIDQPVQYGPYSIRNTFQPLADTSGDHLSGSSGDLFPHPFWLGICRPTHMDNHPHPRVERAGEISNEAN